MRINYSPKCPTSYDKKNTTSKTWWQIINEICVKRPLIMHNNMKKDIRWHGPEWTYHQQEEQEEICLGAFIISLMEEERAK